MSILKISKHSDVPSALDLVKEEIENEAKRICATGGDALKAGKIKPALEAIDYAEKLQDFVKKIELLGVEWSKLQAKIDSAAPEVKEIVLPVVPSKPHKTGYTRNVGKIAVKTNFTVTFPDGTIVADKRACQVLARSIEKLGADKVAALGISVGGEPLVTMDRSLLKKQPNAVVEIANGWWVKTHSSTTAKIDYVKRVAKALRVKLVVKGC